MVIRRKGRLRDSDSDFRRRLATTTRSILTRPFTKAIAEIVVDGDDGLPTIMPVDFTNDILARKMTINVTDQDGNSVRIPSALDAITRAANLLRDELDD